ncbi:MAG: hypothetical protein ACO1NQ_08190 [Flavobacteriales bacterium]
MNQGIAQDRTALPGPDRHFRPHIWASPEDSADFTTFHAGISMEEETLEMTSGDYRALWRVGEHGGVAVVSRRDGTLHHFEGSSIIGLFMYLPFRMADGRRGVMVVHETPCGLICRDTVYYVAE